MSSVRLRINRLPHGRDLALPAPQTRHSAGVDLRAAVAEPASLAPGARMGIPTGIAVEIPPGWEGQVRPRSGLALQHGVTLLNAPGTVDADYRGEVMVILINLGAEVFEVRRGDRVAQLVIAPVAEVEVEEADDLTTSGRGAGGFGSTGSQ